MTDKDLNPDETNQAENSYNIEGNQKKDEMTEKSNKKKKIIIYSIIVAVATIIVVAIIITIIIVMRQKLDDPIGCEITGTCEQPTTTGQISPFGIHGGPNPIFDTNNIDLGVKIVRYGGITGAWGNIEKTKGKYDWSKLDQMIQDTNDADMEAMITVRSFNQWDQGVPGLSPEHFLYPKDINAYLKFLNTFVERYDGDGINDAPNSPVVDYWQIENEVNGNFWSDTPENFAKLLTQAYQTVKSANPDAKVVIGGVSSPKGFDYYIKILKSLTQKSFDIFDLHWYGYAGEYIAMTNMGTTDDFKNFMVELKDTLAQYRYEDVPIWMSETGTHGGVNVVNQTGGLLPQQDEKDQAIELVKRYVYFIDVVMWFKMTETHQTGNVGTSNGYFENTGLINNPLNSDGLSHKKLAYYAYKKMTEILDGSDWDNIEIIQESGGIYIYKFIKNNKPIWVAWNENDNERQITISNLDFNEVLVTETIPKYNSGNDVSNFNNAFNSENKTTNNGKITLTLGETPVYIQ